MTKPRESAFDRPERMPASNDRGEGHRGRVCCTASPHPPLKAQEDGDIPWGSARWRFVELND
ncbi:MAG: hypothetical protein AAGU11_00910 [Syntrophobacteraceae bacterium]